MCTIGIQECSTNIYNLFISPDQYQSRCLCHNRNLYCFQVFFIGILQEFFHICRIYYNSHTFLRFRNCDLSSIQTCIFLRYFVQVDLQSVCQFSDGNRYSAGTEVITFLNQTADLRSAEHTLNLSLCRCITFLNFCSAHFDGTLCMHFGRSCSATDTVTSGTAPQQDNDISRIRSQSLHIFSRSCAHNGTDLHSLCHIVRMIDLFYISGSQADLVTIRRISVSGLTNQLLLWKLAFQGVFYRYRRICCTGYTHSLIYIRSS